MAELRAFTESSTDADEIHHWLAEFGRMTRPLANAAITATLREDSP